MSHDCGCVCHTTGYKTIKYLCNETIDSPARTCCDCPLEVDEHEQTFIQALRKYIRPALFNEEWHSYRIDVRASKDDFYTTNCSLFKTSKQLNTNLDNVNHPKHYTNSAAKCSKCNHPIECIDVTRHLDFNAGNAIKYIWRYKDKNGIEDLKKARWYLDDLIKQLESQDNDKI